jgi:uncharacterized protein DUF4136
MVRSMLKRLGFLCLLLVVGTACTKLPPPEFAYDKAASFADLKTFAWYQGPEFKYPRGGSVVDGRFIDDHVRKDVEAELGKKGYRKEDGGSPDFFVSYATSADGIVDHDRYGAYSWWSPNIYVSSAYDRMATLTLDVRDREKKLIWRGAISRTGGDNPEKVGEAIERAVAELLKNFPPIPKPQ